MQLDSGAQLGPYTVLGHVGSGGMGEVYRARDTRLERVVAIKVLSSTQVHDVERRRHFFQEAKAASALNHPSIVTVYDIGAATVGSMTLDYLVMDYLSGTTLERIIHERAVAVDEAPKYGVQIADALAAAHRAGIVHRDLKPSNVSVTERPFNPVLHRLTSDAGLSAFPALSPDGTLLAYASDRVEEGGLDIWVEQRGAGQPLRLTDDPADDFEPVFSLDGTRIAFRSERSPAGIYVVAALGGDVRLVAPNGRRPRSSPDGASIVYWVGAIGWLPGSSSTYVIPAGGGQPRRIAPTFAAARHPIWTPDGRLLFVGHPGSALGEPELADYQQIVQWLLVHAPEQYVVVRHGRNTWTLVTRGESRPCESADAYFSTLPVRS